jgi:hypothetical protein
LLIPAGVWANEAPTAAPTQTLPAGVSGGNTSSSVGGSNADSAALQPAGGSGLGATNSDSAGLTAPTGQNLQGTANANDQLRVLLNEEADGAPQQPTESEAPEPWLEAALLAVGVTGWIVAWLVRRRQLARAYARYGDPAADR